MKRNMKKCKYLLIKLYLVISIIDKSELQALIAQQIMMFAVPNRNKRTKQIIILVILNNIFKNKKIL